MSALSKKVSSVPKLSARLKCSKRPDQPDHSERTRKRSPPSPADALFAHPGKKEDSARPIPATPIRLRCSGRRKRHRSIGNPERPGEARRRRATGDHRDEGPKRQEGTFKIKRNTIIGWMRLEGQLADFSKDRKNLAVTWVRASSCRLVQRFGSFLEERAGPEKDGRRPPSGRGRVRPPEKPSPKARINPGSEHRPHRPSGGKKPEEGNRQPGEKGGFETIALAGLQRSRITPVNKPEDLDGFRLRIHDPVLKNPEPFIKRVF